MSCVCVARAIYLEINLLRDCMVPPLLYIAYTLSNETANRWSKYHQLLSSDTKAEQ